MIQHFHFSLSLPVAMAGLGPWPGTGPWTPGRPRGICLASHTWKLPSQALGDWLHPGGNRRVTRLPVWGWQRNPSGQGGLRHGRASWEVRVPPNQELTSQHPPLTSDGELFRSLIITIIMTPIIISFFLLLTASTYQMLKATLSGDQACLEPSHP